MKTKFDFSRQLKVGNEGEKLFIKCYKNRRAVKSGGIAFDLIVDDYSSVELKTDSYSMGNTINFFMEKYGNIKAKTLGGPWRAARDGVKFFVYLFLKDKVFFWFDPNKLCNFLDEYVKTCAPKKIENNGWTTVGYLVPRHLCEKLCVRIDRF